jgi:methanogenic corrinoid protein MtbC1
LSKTVLLDKIIGALVDGDDIEAVRIANEALANGISAIDILNKGCALGMMKAGEKYTQGQGGSSLTDLLLTGEAMKAVLEVIKPHLKVDKTVATGKYLIGEIEGDIHSIGREVVKTMLQSAGWEVVDLGEDVPVQRFIEKAKEAKPDIIGAGSAISGSLDKLVELKKRIEAERLPVKYMIGGWSTSPEFAKSLGAYFAKDAVEAVKIANSVHGSRNKPKRL